MAAPTFVSATSTANNTTASKTTASIAVQNGDVLVAYGYMENCTQTYAIATATGSTSAWTLQRETAFAGNITNPYTRAWTATATATGNITVTFSGSATLASLGTVKVWRSSGGIGSTNQNNNNTSAGSPTVSVTTTGANSGLDFSDCDWNAVTGTVTFTASTGTPVTDLSDQTLPSNYCVYSAHVLDVGAIGVKTFGMSAPAGQRFICDVIEVLGTSSSVSSIGSGTAGLYAPKLGPNDRFKPSLAFPPSSVSVLTITAAQGSYSVTGNAQTLFNEKATYAGRGAPKLFSPGLNKGFKPQLSFPPVQTGASLSLTASQGTYTVTGVSTTVNSSRSVAATKGNYVVTGVAATPNAGRSISATQGTYAVSGKPQTLNRGIVLTATQGSYTLSGATVTLPRDRSLIAAGGAYNLTGTATGLSRGRTVIAGPGTYTVTGNAQATPVTLSIPTTAGSYSITGVPVTLAYTTINAPAATHFLPFLVTVGPLTSR